MMFPVKVLQRKSILYTLFIFFLLHLWRYINRKAWLSFAKTKRNLEILKKCPTITKKTFLPCVYLQHHFIQTILAGFVPSKEKDPDFQIEEVSIKGGGHTTLAWATYNRLDYVTHESDRQNSAHKGNNILIVVIPGITGTLEDHYVKDVVNALSNAKYRSVVYLPRLNGQRMIIPDEGVVNNIDDLKATMEHIRSQEPGVKLFGIGHSFGANLLMNFLGKYNEDNGFIGGISLANPFNFVLAENKLRRSIIGQALTKFQKARILKSKKELAGLLKFEFNLDDLHAFKTLRDFDENFMIKLLGFETPDDYYWDLSSFRRMKSIKVPLFMLQSEDDPTADIHAFVREGFDKRNPNVILMMTSKGGHQGWIEGFFSLSRWYLKPTLEFVNAVVSTLEK